MPENVSKTSGTTKLLLLVAAYLLPLPAADTQEVIGIAIAMLLLSGGRLTIAGPAPTNERSLTPMNTMCCPLPAADIQQAAVVLLSGGPLVFSLCVLFDKLLNCRPCHRHPRSHGLGHCHPAAARPMWAMPF